MKQSYPADLPQLVEVGTTTGPRISPTSQIVQHQKARTGAKPQGYAQMLSDWPIVTLADPARGTPTARFFMHCTQGHLVSAQRLAEQVKPPAHIVRRAFALSCQDGRLAVVQWLVDRFSISAEDACEYGCCAFRLACRNGHLLLAQWLANRFSLTASEMGFDNNDALRWACANDHVEVANWLIERCGLALTPAEILKTIPDALTL